MNRKVLLVYNDDGEYKIESVWAAKIGDYYRINSIPFFAKNIAPGDIVTVEEEDDGGLFFDSLIQPSGNSVVRIVIYDENNIPIVTEQLEAFGCNWEGSHLEKLIAVEIPRDISFDKIKQYLEKGRSENMFDYQEACLGFLPPDWRENVHWK
jgi:hypothetical protein